MSGSLLRGNINVFVRRLVKEEFGGLYQVDAVQKLQQWQGYTPCFGGQLPLYPSVSDGRVCNASECIWKKSCDSYRKGPWLSAQNIEYAAQGFLETQLSKLSDVEAIRWLQEREGSSPCFGREIPLRPFGSNPRHCGIWECFWRDPCNAFREGTVEPLERVLSGDGKEVLDVFLARIEASNRLKDQLAFSGSVGLKFHSFENLRSATRKMLLASPKTIVAESSDNPAVLRRYFLHRTDSGMASDKNISTWADILLTADLNKLKRWLLDTREFQDSGSLSYFPLTHSVMLESHHISQNPFSGRAYYPMPSALDLRTFDAPHLGLVDGDLMLSDPIFTPLLNITLPVLENTDFCTLFRLMSDFPQETTSFRNYLLDKVEEARGAAVGSEQFSQDCRRIEREIREEIRKLQSDFKRSDMKSAFTAAGCVVASFTLALYCILHTAPNVLTLLGPGGALYKISDVYIDRKLKQLELKENPAYFLWVLGKTEGGK
jgi:hypothetical protein